MLLSFGTSQEDLLRANKLHDSLWADALAQASSLGNTLPSERRKMTALVQLLIGLAICLLQDAETAKIGRCPPTPFAPGRARFCYSDNQCPGRKKCCLTKSGYACTTPAFYYAKPPTTTPHDTNCDEEENCPKPIPHPSNKQKPGTCPPSNFFTGKAPFCNTDSDCEGSQKCCATKAGTQCITPLTEGRALFCKSDGDCDGSEKCCLTKAGKECVKPVQKPGPTAKPGTCPPYPFGAVGVLSNCQTDFDCKGTLKCCMTSVGFNCTAPVEESREVIKAGECPAAPAVTGKALFCRSDGDCDGSEKCCLTKVGKECVKPVQEPGPTAKPGTCPPYPFGAVGISSYSVRGDVRFWTGFTHSFPTLVRQHLVNNRHCCNYRIGREVIKPHCVSAGPTGKPGTCPPYPFGAVGISSYSVRGDVRFWTGFTHSFPTLVRQHLVNNRHCCNYRIGREVIKAGECPAAPEVTGRALFCKSDGDCDGSEKCCLTKVGKECVKPVQKRTSPLTEYDDIPTVIVFQQGQPASQAHRRRTFLDWLYAFLSDFGREVIKAGECPAAPEVTGRALFCKSDGDCDGSEKCCLTKVGKECVKPVQKRTSPLTEYDDIPTVIVFQQGQPASQAHRRRTFLDWLYAFLSDFGREVIKAGECPAAPEVTGRALFCKSDGDCDGSEKCCLTKVGKECVKPVQKRTSPLTEYDDIPTVIVFQQGQPASQAHRRRTFLDWLYAFLSDFGREVIKAGECPAAPEVTGRALFCKSDGDCDGSEKCCLTKVGKECVKPVQKRTSPLTEYDDIPTVIVFQQGQPASQAHRRRTFLDWLYAFLSDFGREVIKAGECPAAPEVTGRALFCKSDGDCDGSEKCCLTKVGKECVKPVQKPGPTGKPGTCPPYPFGAVGLAMLCQTDFDCKGTLKCCMTSVGFNCTAPVEESGEVIKAGECPAAPEVTGRALLCKSDGDCDGSEKCCLTKVGKECVKPVQKPGPTAKPGTCPPSPFGAVGLAMFCQTDFDCKGTLKCCMTSVGFNCTAPVEESKIANQLLVINRHSRNYPIGREVIKAGECPAAPEVTGRALFCRSDEDCEGSEKCCLTKVGKECVKPVQKPGPTAKPGTCPPYPFGAVGLAMFCQTDFDCKGTLKCCMTSVGFNCTAPVEESREVIKPGECPAVPAITGKALFCRSDEDCDGSYKCCLTSVGRTCVEPAPKPGAVVKPGSCPAVPFGPVGLANFCQSDSDCEGSLKCCVTSVGYECASPVEESLRPSKRGICPWPSSVMEKGRLCSSDGDCQGSRKCCPTKAGNACVKPVSEELAGGRGSCPPAAYVMGVPGSCRRDKDCEVGMKCCDGIDGKSCSVLVVRS
ncbi:hypothetical protein M514_18178 [Trichuris suis]|uniref:WAP domain-containing protein n=1 Tax=Trichuris suis TaxID=68888 RepID=A0A085NJB6_9BILA|nr:hypothetical protein M514_18178 [Trichuris suis]